ncbi:hypothetical protein [Planktotalea sp.]|uniref:hypothetical protein n=1 Tax=Planktotalea sp. TaxID=2029877 RepID=UPI003D6B1BFB
MKLIVKKFALFLITFSVLWFTYVQGGAVVPNYRDHAFHDVLVDIRRDDKVVGWKVFDDKANVGRWTRLGFALALAKFPDAQSCLENPNKPLNIESRLRWSSIKRPKQAAICFFNVAHAFGKRDLVREWLLNMPDSFHTIHGFEGTLGRGQTQYLFLNLTPMAKRHCLVNLYRCVPFHNQGVAIDMGAEGAVHLLHLNIPRMSFN